MGRPEDLSAFDILPLLIQLGFVRGSGGGTINPDHVFIGADRAAAEAARDARFTANPAERTQGIRIALVFGSPQTGVEQTWSGTAWVDLDTVLSPVDIKTLYESNANTNAFTDALQTKLNDVKLYPSLTENTESIDSTKGMRAPAFTVNTGTLNFDNSGELKSTGFSIDFQDMARNEIRAFPFSTVRDSGSEVPAYFSKGAIGTVTGSTLEDSNMTDFNITVTATENQFLRAFIVKPNAVGTGVFVFRYTNADGVTIQSRTEYIVEASQVGTEVTVPLDNSLTVFAGEQTYVMHTGVELRGHQYASDPVWGNQWVPFVRTRRQVSTKINLITASEITNTGSGQVITTAERTKLTNLVNHYRGSFSTTATYAAGDIVKDLYNLETGYFIAEAAIAPSTTRPEQLLDTQQWFLLSDRTWRGTWALNRFVPGQIVSHSSNVWMAVANIPPSDANPPSETNNSWVQIDGAGGGGSGNTPNTIYVRTATRVLDSTTADNTFVSVERTGSDLVTVTFPDAGGSFLNRRITVSNNRSNGLARIQMPTNNTIYTAFNNTQLDLRVGESATLFAVDDNLWDLVHEANVQATPNFPFNEQNDDNTFFFAVNGDTPTTWTRDRDTTINLRSDNGNVTYELANPSTSGIAINDGNGYIFQHTTGGNSAQVFPFSSSNRFFIGATEYTSSNPYTIPLNNSVIITYSSSNNRWEGRAFNFLVQPQGAGGSAGSSGGEDTATRAVIATNEDTVDLIKGDGVYVEGDDGSIAFVKSGLANTLNGYLVEDTAQNEMGQVIRFGEVTSQRIYDGNLFIGAPLAVDTELFWNNTDSRTQLDSDQGAYVSVGKVLSSSFLFAIQNYTTSQTIDTQAEWDAWHSKTNVKNTNIGSFDFQIPDIAEGSSEVTAIAGQSFIVYIPQGNGTLTIRPRGASTIIQGGTSYTNTSPLPLTGGATDEFVFIEVNSAGTGYTAQPLNQKGINTIFLFDWTNYLNKSVANAIQGINVRVQSNEQDITNLKTAIESYVNNATYTIGSVLGSSGVALVNGYNGGMSTWTFSNTNTIPDNRSEVIALDNRRGSNAIQVENYTPNGGSQQNFSGMSTGTFHVMPGEVRLVKVSKFASGLEITPVGPVVYKFEASSTLIGAGNNAFDWVLENEPPSITVPTGNTDRITFALSGKVRQAIEGTANWFGNPSNGFDNVSFVENKNGTLHRIYNSVSLDKNTGRNVGMNVLDDEVDIVASDYLTLTASNLVANDSRITEIKMFFEYILKEY